MRKPRGFWNPARDRLLRRWYPVLGPVGAATKLGVTVAAVRSRAPRIGVSTGRVFWTDTDRAKLRELHPTRTAEEMLAEFPGRTLKSVQQQLSFMGLRKLADRTPLLPRVAELIAQGKTDTAIGRELGIARREVTRLRAQRLKRPVNEAAVAEAKRGAPAAQAAALGIAVGGALRRLAFQRFAAENGWPESLSVRSVQILNVLAEHGPRTKNQLAEALGVPWRGLPSRKVLGGRCPGGSYLAELQRAGLVACVPGGGLCPSKGQGKGRLPNTYTLTPAAITYKEEHEHGRASEEAPDGAVPGRRPAAHARGAGVGRVGGADETGGD